MENEKFAMRLLAICLAAFLLFGCTNVVPKPAAAPEEGAATTGSHEFLQTAPKLPTAQAADCKTLDCFISAANGCKETSLTQTESYGTVNYATKGCTFTKTMGRLNADETQEMKVALEGKSLTCTYDKGAFNTQWVASLVLGIGGCEGGLRDAIAALVIFAPDQ